MKPVSIATVVAVLVALAAGCNSGDAKKKADARPPTGFATEEPPANAPAVFLRGRADGDRAVVEVVARGAARDVHGAAFRLRWDPAKLAFVEARASDAWSASAVRLAKEGLPGELVVAWTEKGGTTGFDATDETILGTIAFAVMTRERTDIAFHPDRSTLRDATGAPIVVEWRGGHVAAR